MSDPQAEIADFLLASGTSRERSLSVAMEFARSMSEELRMALLQWEAVALALQQVKSAAEN